MSADPDDEAVGVTKGGGGAFKSSAKGAAVAKAFARIMEKTRPDDLGLSILSVSIGHRAGRVCLLAPGLGFLLTMWLGYGLRFWGWCCFQRL